MKEKYRLKEEIGYYSGNRRLETRGLKEPDPDNEESFKKWIEEDARVPYKSKLRRWKRNISETIDPSKLMVHIVGQSHLDVAWMWRFAQTRKKAEVTFSKALLHSEMFPANYHFALSQPLQLEWIKEDNIDLFNKIRKFVKKGNIELVGGSYVESDCMMPSGEAMIRQRLYGMRFYRENFGKLPEIEWFLDSFGYNYGLPQILVKSGAKYFWTSKLTWNLDTTFPFVNFWWRSPDGSKILTCNFPYDLTVLDAWNRFELGRHLLKPDGKKIWDYFTGYQDFKTHIAKEICPHIGIFFGLSDGGHGPTHKEVAIANKITEKKWLKWSNVQTFFEEIEKYANGFPIWDDELYLENHRGCFSNHAKIKRQNRKLENQIVTFEVLACCLSLFDSKFNYPIEDFENLWKITLKNQFHDILPGSCIPEVYDDCWDDWKNQDEMIESLKYRMVKKNINKIESEYKSKSISEIQSIDLTLFNSLSWDRKSPLFIPLDLISQDKNIDKDKLPYAKLILKDSKKEFICQPVDTQTTNIGIESRKGWWTIVELPALSLKKAKLIPFDNQNQFRELKLSQHPFKITENEISNNISTIKINSKNGAIIHLKVNDINNQNNLLKGKESNLIFGFLDDEKGHPAWNLHPEYWKHPKNYSNEKDISIKILETGPIYITLEIKKTIGISPVIQRITLFKNLPGIYLNFYTNWKEKNTMLKILYETSTKAEKVAADGMYCTIFSSTNPEVPSDIARYEKICHKFCDLSTPDNDWGLSLINEGKYAFDVKNDKLRLTMLRCCKYPDPSPEAWVNIERNLNKKRFYHDPPRYSGLGPLNCKYLLFPHKGGPLKYSNNSPNVQVKRRSEEFNNHIQILPGNIKSNLAEFGSLFEKISSNVFLGALKKEEWSIEDAYIFRFIEVCGEETNAYIKLNEKLAEKIYSIESVDLLERRTAHNFRWDKEKQLLTFQIGGFEIKTFKIVFI
jgi:alpha-mannosidase